ncbi:MAG: hypothetical protein M4579_001528 [Chaenotheca gracillima]|nr:MAG: hypothetical protein M4579_001528 [Chaenotheca gracillima]
MAAADVQMPPQETKFSRYRSVRNASAKPSSSSPEPPTSPQNDSIARSMSRYRRGARPATAPHPPPPAISSPQVRAIQDQPVQSPPGSRIVSASRDRIRSSSHAPVSKTQPAPDPFSDEPPRVRRREHQEKVTNADRNVSSNQDTAPRETRRDKEDSARRKEEQRGLRQRQQEDREFEERLQKIKQQELERLERELDAAQPFPMPEPKPKSRFGFFSRRKQSKPLSQIAPRQDERKASSKAPSDAPRGIEPGGGGIVPGTDAPISAVNAGERRVKIKCNDAFINLPVLPETTSSDLIYSTTNCLNQNIRPEKSMLLESFTQLGLERPIRSYERVREILNSWDRDTQNGLILVPTVDAEEDRALKVDSVSFDPPEVSVYLYYSQRPRKWDKRWVTLRADGQMVVAKKMTAKEKDVSNICHVSDFDIYTPTRRQITKVLKPPKKTCFAIKSQQKSSMFLSTANFVHFFATGDRKHATEFYRAVQGWRSWYLVHKKGEGQPQAGTSRQDNAASLQRRASRNRESSTSRRNPSVDNTPYQIGSFKSLVPSQDARFSAQGQLSSSPPKQTMSAETAASTKAIHARNMSAREKRAPPVSFPGRLASERSGSDAHSTPENSDPLVASVHSDDIDAATFAPTGLLGRTYSQKRQNQRTDRERAASDGPFTNGPSLLNGGGGGTEVLEDHPRVGRTHSIRSSKHNNSSPSSDLRRGSSQRQKPKPLLDFSNPEYREPPQFSKKNRGRAHVPQDLPPGSNLIDAATSPERAIEIPPATTWRRPSTQHRSQNHVSGGAPGRSNTIRTSQTRPYTSGAGAENPFDNPPRRNRTTHDDDVDSYSSDGDSPESLDAFTGLLGNLPANTHNQGGTGTGRGVRTGDRMAKGPMLDVREPSHFTKGSLLEKVERKRTESGSGPEGPVIEREKRYEMDVGVGEGI